MGVTTINGYHATDVLNPFRPRGRAGFSLIELLVTVGIIGLLVALILPALLGARKRALLAQCQANLVSLYQGFAAFTVDHDGRLPGNYYTRNESEYWKTDWLGGQGPLPDTGPNPDPATINAAFAAAPEQGTLFPYVGRLPLVFRCPALPAGTFGQGTGSNGKFDYSTVGILAGAILDNLQSPARFRASQTSPYESHPAPLVLQEDPANHINTKYIEGCHGHIDKFATLHDGGSPYAACDGSIHVFAPPSAATFWNWELMTPRGEWWCQYTDFQAKKYGLVWGEWNQK